MRTLMLLGVILGVLTAAGCQAGARTPGEVWGFCMNADSEMGKCSHKNAVCDRYKEILQKEYASAEACREACYEVQQHFVTHEGAMGCTKVFLRGESLCTQNCNSRF